MVHALSISLVNFIGDGTDFAKTLKSTTLLFMRSSNVSTTNRDNGASDLWTLTAYSSSSTIMSEKKAHVEMENELYAEKQIL